MARRTLKSTKSSSASKAQRKNSRYVDFRPVEPGDLKYIGVAYRKGALDSMHPVFREEMTAGEFKAVFMEYAGQFGSGWTFLAETKEGIRPVGFCLAWTRVRVIQIGEIIWFPWASKRSIWESSRNFFDVLRKTVHDDQRDVNDPIRYYTALEFSHFKDKRFFERMSNLGIMRRVGHVLDIYEGDDSTAVLFQTQSPVRR